MNSLFFVSAVTSVCSLVLGLIGGWLGRRGRLNVQRKLGVHRPRVSTLGGPAVLGGAWIGLGLAAYGARTDYLLSPEQMKIRAWGIAVALLVMFLWGLWIEWRQPSRHRLWLLLGQGFSGLLLFLFGFRIVELSLGGWVFGTGLLNLPVTLLWVVLVINFIRFFDGIDGLPAVVGLAIVGIHVFGVPHQEYFVHLLCAVFGGVLVGIFLVTVYPARVYLGYNGSSLPGVCLAALTLASRSKTFTTATVFIPVMVLVVIAAFALVLFVESRILMRRERGER